MISFLKYLLRVFGLTSDYRNIANEIGKSLHSQIHSALKENENLASKKINSPFFAGYYAYYVQMSFIQFGLKSNDAEDYYEFICEGIMPNKLWSIFNEQLNIIENTKNTDFDLTKEFEYGCEVGMWDGSNINNNDINESRNNLNSFLLNKSLNYKKI